MTVWIAGVVTLVGAVAIALIGWWVGSRHVPQAAEEVTPRVSRARLRYFVALSVALVLALIVTLPRLPYPAGAEPPVRVRAIASMWAWRFEPAPDVPGLSATDVTSAYRSLAYLDTDGRLIVPVGRPVTFDVAATDVNHGFGVYDQRGRLLGQTQAMPGYVNRLTLVFPEPGSYQVLCLEYCGVAHHVMAASIEAQ